MSGLTPRFVMIKPYHEEQDDVEDTNEETKTLQTRNYKSSQTRNIYNRELNCDKEQVYNFKFYPLSLKVWPQPRYQRKVVDNDL